MPLKHIFLIIFILSLNTTYSQEQIIIGQKHVIHSVILNEDRTYQIHLPQSYNWALDRKYPVLFVLDGESNFLQTVGSVDFLSSKGEIPELIIVGIVSTVRIRDFTQTDWPSHWIGGGGAEIFKRFLSRELIPKIEHDFRTNSFRILSGHSAAGQFVLYTLTSKPSLFNAYFAISPSLDWDNNIPQRSLEESLAKRDSLKAFLYFAWSNDFGKPLEDDLRLVQTLATKSPRGFRSASKSFPNETHGSVTLLAQIDALRQLYFGYRYTDDLVVYGFKFAEKHFQEVSNIVGYNIPVPENVFNSFGYEELNKGNIKEAISIFERNIKQNPYSANAYDSIADAYEKAGMWREAIVSSEKAVELAKKHKNPNLSYFVEHAKTLKKHYKSEDIK